MYRSIIKPILFRFDPEAVHNAAVSFGEWAGHHAVMRALARALWDYPGRTLEKTVDGITYRTPFVLAAGFDYNGRLARILPTIGLGGEEVGSLTAKPCEGNPKPRLTRLPKSEAILVYKGLRNAGVDAYIRRYKNTPREDGFVVGVSIARTNSAAACGSMEDGIADYAYSLKRLVEEDVGEYYTINISCPNVFGGEAFTTPQALRALLKKLRTIPHKKPMYVKMPINVPWDTFQELLEIVDALGMHGVVIGNSNKEYASLAAQEEIPPAYRGGLSGKPCRALSTELIRKTRERFGKRFTIIGCGGVMSPEAALEKFKAGADLVQLVSGLIFEGPGLIRACAGAYAQVYEKRN